MPREEVPSPRRLPRTPKRVNAIINLLPRRAFLLIPPCRG